MSYRVRDFDPDALEDAARLAELFNSFDSIWPGGFTHGVPHTAESVLEQHKRARRLAVCIAEHESGEFAGYCNLNSEVGITDRAYLPLLGASPKHLNQGVGKMLLREMIRRVTENGFRQLTLGTWGGNLKAVSLYKKTGFHWVPETNVHMRNFIPGCLNSPQGQVFFANRDWYACLKREILVAPDEVKWHGRNVFPYHFQDGDEYLTFTFDSVSEALTALETPEYSVACWLEAEECAAGETYPVIWEIRNRGAEPLEIVILTEADAGLELKVQERRMVTETETITQLLRVLPEAQPPRSGESAARIRSTVLVNGQPVRLETGVNIVRPVEISVSDGRMLTGIGQRITVKLRSRLDRDLIGTLALDPHPALVCEGMAQEFTLSSRSWTECVFTVRAITGGVLPTALRLAASETRLERAVVFRAFSASEPLAFCEPVENEKAALETPNLQVGTWLRGGWCGLYHGANEEGVIMHPMAELGPPFAAWRERPRVLTNRIERTADLGLCLVQSVASPEQPGLIIERTLSLIADNLARLAYRVINTTDLPQPAHLRLTSYSTPNDTVVLPTPQGLIREPRLGRGSYPSGERDALPTGAPLAEEWIACEGDGMVAGLLWEGEPKRDMQWTNLMNFQYDLGELPPHSDVAAPALYLVGGKGDWQTVREWWRRIHHAQAEPEARKPQPGRVLEAAFEPSPALLTGESGEATLAISNRRGQTLNGTLALDGKRFQVEPTDAALTEIDRDRPLRMQVRLTGPEEPTASLLQATIDSGMTAQTFALPVIQLGTGETLRVTSADDGRLVVENGYLSFQVAPAFRGSLVGLERNGVEHLFSAYPEPKPFVWWNPWYGGLFPSLDWEADELLAKETFTGEPVARTGERGLSWQGVRVRCRMAHKNWSWLGLEAEYLTLAGTNLIALITRWTNHSTARMQTSTGVNAWLQPGGTRANTVAYWVRDGEGRLQRRSAVSGARRSGPWAAVENPETGDILALITADPGKHVWVEDMAEEGAHLHINEAHSFAPGETRETLTWLALTSGIEAAEAYASLAKVERLP